MQRVRVDVATGADRWTVTVRHDTTPSRELGVFDMPWVDLAVPTSLAQGGRTVARRVPAPGATGPSTDGLTELFRRQLMGQKQPGDAATYGTWLFASLLEPAWPEIAAITAAGETLELALVFPSDDVHLGQLIWEAMMRSGQPLAGGLTPRVAITRLVPGSPAVEPGPMTELPKVLFAVGAALHDPTVRPGAMFLGLLRQFETSGSCRARVITSANLDRLARECEEFQPHVVHIVAHGKGGDDGIVTLSLGGDDATVAKVAAAVGRPTAVLLSACESGARLDAGSAGGNDATFASALVAAGIPVVVAMAGKVGEQACRLFTRRLAEAMEQGLGLVDAASDGRRAALNVADLTISDDLDWARPALYIAESVHGDVRLLDPDVGRSANHRDGQFGLSAANEPLFAGRLDQLRAAERAGTDPVGLMLFVAEQLQGQHSERFLRQAASRLLRAGHVPVLLRAARKDDRPRSMRDVVVALLARILDLRTQLELDAVWFKTLEIDGAAAPAVVTFGSVEAALLAMKSSPVDLAAGDVRQRLAGDLDALRTEVADTKGSRVVVLIDRVDDWMGGLEHLLSLLGPDGLGRAGQVVPLIATASFRGLEGDRVRELTKNFGGAWAKFPALGPFTPDEAVVAYQWMLLHPWQQDPATMLFGKPAFVAADASGAATWDAVLRKHISPDPDEAEEQLYVTANSFTEPIPIPGGTMQVLRRFDDVDDRAITEYEKHR